jgi:hypothetical protein
MTLPLLLLTALAQAPAADPPVLVQESDRRLLIYYGVIVGGGIENATPSSLLAAPGSPGPVGAVGLGGYFGIGEQFDDRWGLGPEIGAGTSIFMSYGRAALAADYTPADWFTLAVGPATWVDGVSIRGCPAFGCGASTAEAAGGTLRLDFHGGANRTARGRHAFTFGIVTDLGATVGENSGGPFGPGFAWAVYLAFGDTDY